MISLALGQARGFLCAVKSTWKSHGMTIFDFKPRQSKAQHDHVYIWYDILQEANDLVIIDQMMDYHAILRPSIT